jgi:hypothetical protein
MGKAEPSLGLAPSIKLKTQNIFLAVDFANQHIGRL